MTQRARQLVDDARKSIVSTEERIRLHPYLNALEKRGVGKGKLAMFGGQQRHIIKSDLRSVELALSRAETAAAREFLAGMVEGEKAALGALVPFGRALGLTPELLDSAEPLPGAFAYSAFVAWLAANGTTAEFVGAFIVNLEAWGANCGRISRALQGNYGFAKEDVSFFDLFASTPAGFEERGLMVVEEGLERGADPKLVCRAARLLQGYELMFWDTIWEAAKS
jgi:pyrroloquinoline quinone (PQQ) biosynthesis protein C